MEIEPFNGNFCRTCLGEEGPLESVSKIHYGSDKSLRMADIINIYISPSVHISENDGFPNEICACCSKRILEFYKFNLNIEKNQKILKSGIRTLSKTDQMPNERNLVFDTSKLDEIKREVEWSINEELRQEEMRINEFEEENYNIVCERDDDEVMEKQIVIKQEDNNSGDGIKKEPDDIVFQESNISKYESDNNEVMIADSISEIPSVYVIKQEENTIRDKDWPDENVSEVDTKQEKAPRKILSSPLPAKSREVYNNMFNRYEEWCLTKKIENITDEKVVLSYFQELSKTRKSSSLWSYYSMLRSVLTTRKYVDISKYVSLLAFLRRLADGYMPRKSKVFTKQDVAKFLIEAENEKYLLMKVALIIGLSGACTREELKDILLQNVKDEDNDLLQEIQLESTSSNETHQNQINPGNEKPFKCEQCHKSFPQKYNLKIHLLTHSEEKPFKCDHCHKAYSVKCNLKSHLLKHSGEKAFKCEHCDKTFSLKGTLKTHLITHSGEKGFECQICNKKFARKSNLKPHILTHSFKQPFECEYCHKSFTQRSNLQTHLLKHTGNKLFECDHCCKTFPTKFVLNNHLLTHTGEKPYECEHCLKKFRQKSNLEAHILIHTGVKTNECHQCHKTFLQKSQLKTHILSHSGKKKFECAHCHKTFAQKVTLQSHLLTHSGEKPFQCEHCQKTFTQKSALKTHLSTHVKRELECKHCHRKFKRKDTLKSHLLEHSDKTI